jgi:hypothetical protein
MRTTAYHSPSLGMTTPCIMKQSQVKAATLKNTNLSQFLWLSARNPPPYCVGAPFLKEWGEVCIRFHDLNATKHSLHGCVEAEAEFKGIEIAKYELGCFDIGPKRHNDAISVVRI